MSNSAGMDHCPEFEELRTGKLPQVKENSLLDPTLIFDQNLLEEKVTDWWEEYDSFTINGVDRVKFLVDKLAELVVMKCAQNRNYPSNTERSADELSTCMRYVEFWEERISMEIQRLWNLPRPAAKEVKKDNVRTLQDAFRETFVLILGFAAGAALGYYYFESRQVTKSSNDNNPSIRQSLDDSHGSIGLMKGDIGVIGVEANNND